MNARILYLIIDDVKKGSNVESNLEYFRRSLEWFHKSIRERDFSFMLPRAEDPSGTIGRRPDYYRKEGGEARANLIRLAVAGGPRAFAEMCSAIRADAEQYLVQRFLELVDRGELASTIPALWDHIDRLKQGVTFSQLSNEAQFVADCSADLAFSHEWRLRDYAMLTRGLCA
jgi:hypothetical protein